jgi:hypothetical protein
MTQQVRTTYRNHRRGTWAAVLLVLVVASLSAIVLPATGATTDVQVGLPSDPLGVPPYENAAGGNTFNCSDINQTEGLQQFKINNPKTGTYSTTVDGVPVSFTIAVSGGQNRDKYLSFKSQNVAVWNVAINGGSGGSTSKTALYTYDDPALADGYGSGTISPLTVDTDGGNGKTGLHAPVDSSGTPYNLSYTTFCFTLATVTPSCEEPFSGIGFAGTGGVVTYTAQLVEDGGCKEDNVVMYSYTPGTNQLFATLNPIAGGGTQYQVVEHIHWTGIGGDVQNPITLRYDDTAPYDGVDNAGINNINGGTNDGWRIMKMCGSDPRPAPDSFDLGGVTPVMPSADPLPAGGQHSSCMLLSSFSAGDGPSDRAYDAWVYSLVDGARGNFVG